MKQVEKTILNAALDEAKETAMRNAQEGVNMVIGLLNDSKSEGEQSFIMAGALARGFQCEFWPVNGGMGVRVRWENPR